MAKQLTESNILIVEDHKGNRDTIVRLLIEEGIPMQQIETTDNAGEAKTLIDEFEPDIILLDITIMREEEGEENSLYSYEVIEKVRLYNHENPDKIKIIIISGTVENEGIQRILRTEGENIISFIDKIWMSSDMEKFKSRLKKDINKALRFTDEGEFIEFSDIRNSNLRLLKRLHSELWEKIEEEILDNLERMNLKDVNEHNEAKNVIMNCGQVVEFIIYFLEGRVSTLKEVDFSNDQETVRNKLTRLSGRKFNESTKSYTVIADQPVISRKACEYAYRAYHLRNQASHDPQMDDKNKNIYKDARLDKWDAKIALDLIVPLLNEYIKRLKEKQ